MSHPKEILDRYEIDPKKSLGQNFLFDERILKRIVDQADIKDEDHVLEIGAGLGSLTTVLAEHAARVVTVELDDRLIPFLNDSLSKYPHVEVVHGDILDLDLSTYFPNQQPFKVVANVPYYITGAITRHILSNDHKPDRVVLTVQKDVAERMTAAPPQMSLLSTSVQFYGEAKMLFNLSAGSFYPRPKVASSVVRIDLEQRQPSYAAVKDETRFFRIVKAGFSQKRKQLLNNLSGLGIPKPEVNQWCDQAKIDSRRRAETLSIQEWVSLYQSYPTPTKS